MSNVFNDFIAQISYHRASCIWQVIEVFMTSSASVLTGARLIIVAIVIRDRIYTTTLIMPLKSM